MQRRRLEPGLSLRFEFAINFAKVKYLRWTSLRTAGKSIKLLRRVATLLSRANNDERLRGPETLIRQDKRKNNFIPSIH